MDEIDGSRPDDAHPDQRRDAARTEEQFDEIVAAGDSAMVVVTVAAGDRYAGCLVGFHSQSSIEPRRYTVWLSKLNDTEHLAHGATHFAVHLLGAGDRELAELFGGTTGDEVDKFQRCEWAPGPGGVPLLARCPRRFVGRRVGTLDTGGDHVGFVLAPVQAQPGDGPPLRLSDVDDIVAGHPPEVPGSS